MSRLAPRITNTELFGSVDTEATQMEEKGDGAAFGQNTMQKYQKHIMRGSAVLFIPMTMNFPAGREFMFQNTILCSSIFYSSLLYFLFQSFRLPLFPASLLPVSGFSLILVLSV